MSSYCYSHTLPISPQPSTSNSRISNPNLIDLTGDSPPNIALISGPARSDRCPSSVNYRSFYQRVNVCLGAHSTDPTTLRRTRLRGWRTCYEAYVISRPELEERARVKYSTNAWWSIASLRSYAERDAREIVGRAHIISRLTTHNHELEDLISIFLAPVATAAARNIEIRGGLVVQHHNAIPNYIQEQPQPTTNYVPPRPVRKRRVMWTDEEDRIVIRHSSNLRGWASAASEIGNGRTGCGCKDRWRTLLRKWGSREAILWAYANQPVTENP